MPGKGRIDIATVDYRCFPIRRHHRKRPPLEVIGLDTEADITGRCRMIATSRGDVLHYSQWPAAFFTRAYRGRVFVAYNLKYDEGALLQVLTKKQLRTLREKGKVNHAGYQVRAIPGKMLVWRKGRNAITVYDMYNFYGGSLEYNAQRYLGTGKADVGSKAFDPSRFRLEWKRLGAYCIQDARLVKGLADLILARFRSYGMEPRKLFSTAYVSWQYFSTHTAYPVVRRYWRHHREVLQFAMDSYNGGKFEVVRKGPGTFWEYDINSAYPYEIAQLYDISWARVLRQNTVPQDCLYGFLHVRGNLPIKMFSPVAYVFGGVNVYPVGPIRRCITLEEYRFLLEEHADIEIEDAFFLCANNRQRPFAHEIARLAELKNRAKRTGDLLDYHTVKILLNSLYGKMVQLIKDGERWRASTCWNPIYGAIITARVRIRVSRMQAQHPSIVAVHTDSVLSTAALPFPATDAIGAWCPSAHGEGVVLGSGIYQIGEKVRFRGFDARTDLRALLDVDSPTIAIADRRAFSWREVAFHGWPLDRINLFADIPKHLHCRFDRKRVWLGDWTVMREALSRTVDSIPHSELSIPALSALAAGR